MNKHFRGFTLLELVISLAISAVLLVLVVSVFFALQSARIKQQAIAEVEGQGIEALSLITQSVRNAIVITTPATSTTAATLSMTTYVASTSPTVFALSGSVLRMTEGVNAAIDITNAQVTASNLSFQNVSRPTTSGNVKIQFTLTYATTTGRFDTTYSKTFYGSATVRRLQQ